MEDLLRELEAKTTHIAIYNIPNVEEKFEDLVFGIQLMLDEKVPIELYESGILITKEISRYENPVNVNQICQDINDAFARVEIKSGGYFYEREDNHLVVTYHFF